jgi:hypothetical protein
VGARKGQNNFKKIQRTRVTEGKLLISHTLNCIKRGVVFRDINALIVYVADRTKMHRTTIARNSEYVQLILNHFASQSGAVDLISDSQADAATLRAKLLACQTKVTNVEMENLRLKRALGLDRTASDIVTEKGPNETSEQDEHLTSDVSFANTAMALLILLERLNEKELGVALDLSKKQIIDLAEVGARRVIVGALRTKWFFEWLSLHTPALGEKSLFLN